MRKIVLVTGTWNCGTKPRGTVLKHREEIGSGRERVVTLAFTIHSWCLGCVQ